MFVYVHISSHLSYPTCPHAEATKNGNAKCVFVCVCVSISVGILHVSILVGGCCKTTIRVSKPSY